MVDSTFCTTRRTTCPYCGVGCGLLADVRDGELRELRGDPDHPANAGRLCVKGMALRETLGSQGRLLRPRLYGLDSDWDSALGHAATRLRDIVRQHGPDAVAFYLSGQLLTEDYYVANKLMKGFIGSANVDTNSRLCMASATAAHKRAFGEDLVPGCYEDLEHAELVLLVGSNAAYAHPILFQRLLRARERDPARRVIVLDPRRTATCEIADLHLALRPGSDAWFFNGLLAWLADHDGLDHAFLAAHCDGFEAALAQARAQGGLADTARFCEIDADILRHCYELFSRSSRVVTLFSQGINQSASGVDKANAIINCHLASGKIGRPGAAPFSITGQPNAMGGREVGGLANQLAAHMHFDPHEIALVERFWRAPRMARRPGLKAVELFDAIGRGEVKAVWIMATNPAVSLCEADKVREALRGCELVMVSECYAETDTLDFAHVAFPAAAWSEKTGTVTNSERCISLQRALVAPPGEAWPDWRIICALAQRLGYGEAFGYRHPAEILSEHAALSGYGNHGTRGFDISALAGISKRAYENLRPLQWPINAARPCGTRRLFEDGRFFHTDGRARLVPVTPRAPAATKPEHGFLLNSGRSRDQWHTMTRTGRVPRLLTHLAEPTLDIHPLDAATVALGDGALAEVSNANARLLVRVRHNEAQRHGELFLPIHWTDRFSARARVSALVSAVCDPLSGQPEFKQCAVHVAPWVSAWSGVLLCRELRAPDCDYWTRVPVVQGHKYLLAGKGAMPGRAWLAARFPDVDDWVELKDSADTCARVAGFRDERLEVALLCEQDSGSDQGAWLEALLGSPSPGAERHLLLVGGDGGEDIGEIICACFQVGRKTIESGIRDLGCASVEALGRHLRCGTNCGSCVPELRSLLKANTES